MNTVLKQAMTIKLLYAVLIVAGTILLGVAAVSAWNGNNEGTVNIENYYAGSGEIMDGEIIEDELIGGRPIHAVYDFRNGITVAGTAVIDSSGNWDGAITGTSATLSSTLGVTGAATFSSTVGITGASTLTGDLTVNTSDFVVDVSEDRVAINTSTLTHTFAVATSTGALYAYIDEGGDFVVDTSVLFVDASANRIGINDVTPSYSLDITGDANITATTTIDTDTLYVDITNDRIGVNTSSPDVDLHVIGTTTSTIETGETGVPGCWALQDSDGAGVTYVTALNGSLTTSTEDCST